MTLVELQQPRRIIARINGRDLRILVDHPHVYLRREDVEELASIPPWNTGETLLLNDDQVAIADGIEYYPLEIAMRRAEYEALEPGAADAFLAWVRRDLPAFLSEEVLDAAHQVPGFANAYPVAAAARLLSEDPLISIGRDQLFEHMAGLGWIERNAIGVDMWVPTHTATRRDLVTTRVRTVGPRKQQRRYLQIHVTNAGLSELRRSLAASAPQPAPAQPTLFD